MLEKIDAMRKLRDSQSIYVVFSMATKCPYVVCDPETFDDEILVYLTEEEAKARWEQFRTEEIPVQVARVDQPNFLVFYTSLYTMGINAIVVHSGEEKATLQLEELVRRGDMNNQPNGSVWVENPQLHLTAMYLMQTIRRKPGIPMGPKEKEMLEEIVANFSKGRFIQPVRTENKAIPLLQLQQGEKYQPIFTDIMEFQKFNRNNDLSPLVMEAEKVPQVLVKEAVGIVINPLGVNLPLKMQRKDIDIPAGGAAAMPADAQGAPAAPAAPQAPVEEPEGFEDITPDKIQGRTDLKFFR